MESVALTVEALESYIAEKRKLHMKPLGAQAEKHQARLKAHLSELRGLGEQIAAFKPSIGEMERPFAGAIHTAKEALAAAALKEWRVDAGPFTDFEAVVKLKNDAEAVVKHLVNVCASNRRIAYTFLKSHIKRLEGKMKDIADEVAGLDRLAQRHREEAEAWRRALQLSRELSGHLRDARESEEQAKALRNQLSRMESALSSLDGELQAWLQDPQYARAAQLESELRLLEGEAEHLVQGLRKTLSGLRRALDKYRYLIAADKKRVVLLEALEDLAALFEMESHDDLQALLLDVEKRATRGEIQLKNPAKAAASLRSLAGELPNMAARYRELQRRLQGVKERLAQSPRHRAESLRASLSEQAAAKTRLEERLTRILQQRARYLSQAAQTAERLKECLRTTLGIELTLVDLPAP